MLRRLRSALTIAAVWGLAWIPVGVMFGAARQWFGLPPSEADIVRLTVWALCGAASGFTFALLLAWLERGRQVETMRFSRMATWGTIAGAGVPAALGIALVLLFPGSYFTRGAGGVIAFMSSLGACSALASLAFARSSRARVSVVEPPG
jgi:hypothetical protein